MSQESSSTTTLTQNEAQPGDVIRKSPVSRTISDTTTVCTNRRAMTTEPRSKSVTFDDRPDVESVRKRRLQRTPTPYWDRKDMSPTLESIGSSFDEEAPDQLVATFDPNYNGQDVFASDIPLDNLEECQTQSETAQFCGLSDVEELKGCACADKSTDDIQSSSKSCKDKTDESFADDIDQVENADESSDIGAAEITDECGKKSKSKLGCHHSRLHHWLFGLFRFHRSRESKRVPTLEKDRASKTENNSKG